MRSGRLVRLHANAAYWAAWLALWIVTFATIWLVLYAVLGTLYKGGGCRAYSAVKTAIVDC